MSFRPMPTRPDRAAFIAGVLMTRLRTMEEAFLDEADPSDHHEAAMRQDMVAKVPAVEAGVTDGPTVQLVASALPRINLLEPPVNRDIAQLADFLRFS